MSENLSRIVVGVDGSERGLDAARWAGAVAAKIGTSLHLVHSTSLAGSFFSDAAIVAIRAAAAADQYAPAEKILLAAEQAVHQHHGELSVTTEVIDEPATTALVTLSQTARMIVVGSDDLNPAAALLLGSTSLTVATHALCPVVVWRNVSAPDTRPVVVGVDGARAGASALAAGFEYAHSLGAGVTAVHAWSRSLAADQVNIPYLIDWEAVQATHTAVLRTALDPWRARYPDVDVTCVVEPAKPGRALLNHLDNAQMVVVGNRGHNAFTAAVLGSTTSNLLHHSAVPVMVCHVADGASEGSPTKLTSAAP